MKNVLKFNFIMVLIFSFAVTFSCSNDDDTSNTNSLIGTWQRTDSNANFEYTLEFKSDFTGYRTNYETDGETETSSIIEISWSTDGNMLTMMLNEEVITNYSFNSSSQLVLSDFSTFPFDRLD